MAIMISIPPRSSFGQLSRLSVIHISQRLVQIRADENVRSSKMLSKLLGSDKASSRRILHPTSVVIAKGAPKFVTELRGHAKSINRRQIVLNKHFMEGLTDVLLTEKIGVDLNECGVRITQCEVCKHFNYLNIYWTTNNTNTSEVGEKLNQMTGALHKHLIERNFLGRVPIVKFNYDQTSYSVEKVQFLLKGADYGKNFRPNDPTKFAPPTQVLTGDPAGMPEIKTRFFKKMLTVYDQNVEYINSLKAVNNDYKIPTFNYPADMNLGMLGIDYLSIMNKVLFHMKKSRAEHRGHVPIADPLPPAEWVAPPMFPMDDPIRNDVMPNTDERVMSMKNFVVENKKKRQRMFRASRNATDKYLVELSDSLDDVHERIKTQYEEEDYPADAEDQIIE